MTISNLENITAEQFEELKKKFDNAENDTTPFMIVDENDDDKIKVIGDVSKTAPKKYTYTIDFGYRNTELNRAKYKDEKIIGMTDNYIGVSREYKDAWIPPIRHTEVQATLIQLYKFFNAITDDGELRDLTPDETLMALQTMNNEMLEAMCDVVCVVLNIPLEESQYILPSSAIMATLRFADDFPEVVNGMDFTGDKSLESK